MTHPSTARSIAVRALAALVAGTTVLLGCAGVAQATSFGTPAPAYTAGGISANGAYYARSGSALTLVVNTDDKARCVSVEGLPNQTSAVARTSWTFSAPTAAAGTADGVQNRVVTIGETVNPSGNCATKVSTTSVSYLLDNTGPSVSASVNPQPNGAGWNAADATVSWTANDGTGVGGGTVAPGTTVSTDTAGQAVTGSATDALGNAGPVSTVVVRRDTAVPAVTGARSPAANAAGWNNTDVTATFTCSDALSLIKSCVAGGSSPAAASRTLGGNGAGQSVSGTATDNAGNTATATVVGINIDKQAPTITATGGPYTAGTWSNHDVTVTFDCADQVSGVASCTGPAVIGGEGADQSATGSAADRAGNTASATFGDVDIDKTAPNTTATAPQTAWNNTGVAVSLAAADALSGVAATHYTVNGGPAQTGAGVTFSAEGSYQLAYWSVDNAGNTEAVRSATVRIDRTPPAIGHTQSPAANANGWSNADVTVTFTCTDGGGSGVASCGPDRTVTTEGQNQPVTGTAVDNAGNSTSDPATVSIDKTAPAITATRTSAATPTGYGWYNADVTVSYACADAGSGIDSCTPAQTLGEGADQSASGTAVDAAGNTATAGVGGISVDSTPPALHGTPSTGGWSGGDVTVAWTCTDGGSGVAGAPAPSTVSGEGDNLSASATCTDKAGNSTTSTVGGIRIDRAAPHSAASVAQPFTSGWYADAVTVTLSAADALSGVATTYYAVDGGPAQPYTGPFAFTSAGRHALGYWSVDAAGNTEDATGNALALWIDDAAPTIAGARSPAPNTFGWSNTPVTVSFACADTQSGVAGCTDPVQLGTEGSGQGASGTATDGVGKTAGATVGGIDVDLTAPTVTGAPTTGANAGWYTGDVTIHWTALDGLSGIDPATQPADSVVGGEGRNLVAGPVTVQDRAGNASAPTSVTGIGIDRAAPVVTGGPITQPNPAGWYRDEVVVDFACADPLLADGTAGSGVASCPGSTVFRGDGANQSVTSERATDVAGNTAAAKVVGGISIDGTAPATSSNNQCSRTNGWCTGTTANVVLTATDQAGLSGVKEIHYRIDGGTEQVSAGSSRTVAVPLDGSGAGTVEYWSVDNAGNAEQANAVSLKWDNIAPTVTHTVSPAANADDWNNAPVTVHFTARDDDAGSGLDPASVTPDVVVGTETGGLLVTGSASDVAGNRGTDSVTVKLDRTAPSIAASIAAGVHGANGWYTGPVTVHFTCTDPNGAVASGLPATACPDDVRLSTDGAGRSVTRSVTDRAGNTASATLGGIDIDQERPVITSVSVRDGAIYLGTPAAPVCTATDAGSGVDSCAVQVTALATAGDYAFTATARDRAGNAGTQSGRYHVNLYRFGGFLQPIDDPSIQPGAATSVFKAGSTVPVKFQLRSPAGALTPAPSAPAWLVPVKGGLTTAPVSETSTTDTASPDGVFRWDATAQQYIYNWQTKGLSAGYYYRIGVRLDDGQVFSVTVGLK